jgi:hypothetical protein
MLYGIFFLKNINNESTKFQHSLNILQGNELY